MTTFHERLRAVLQDDRMTGVVLVPADLIALLEDLDEAFTRGELVETKDLAGIMEVADFFDTGRSNISNWSARRTDNKMPKPVATLGCGTIWNLRELITWWKGWHPANGRKVGKLPPGW